MSNKSILLSKQEKCDHGFGLFLEFHCYAIFHLAHIKVNAIDTSSTTKTTITSNQHQHQQEVENDDDDNVDWSMVLTEISVAKKVAMNVFFLGN